MYKHFYLERLGEASKIAAPARLAGLIGTVKGSEYSALAALNVDVHMRMLGIRRRYAADENLRSAELENERFWI
jgi:hypothetical protein